MCLCAWECLDETGITGILGSKGNLRIVCGVSCCDEVFLRNAKLRRLNELTYQAREEFNLMQLLGGLHIYRLHKQVIHTLRCASRHRNSKQHNPQIMFAELLCPQLHSIQAQALSIRVLARLYFRNLLLNLRQCAVSIDRKSEC